MMRNLPDWRLLAGSRCCQSAEVFVGTCSGRRPSTTWTNSCWSHISTWECLALAPTVIKKEKIRKKTIKAKRKSVKKLQWIRNAGGCIFPARHFVFSVFFQLRCDTRRIRIIDCKPDRRRSWNSWKKIHENFHKCAESNHLPTHFWYKNSQRFRGITIVNRSTSVTRSGGTPPWEHRKSELSMAPGSAYVLNL